MLVVVNLLPYSSLNQTIKRKLLIGGKAEQYSNVFVMLQDLKTELFSSQSIYEQQTTEIQRLEEATKNMRVSISDVNKSLIYVNTYNFLLRL